MKLSLTPFIFCTKILKKIILFHVFKQSLLTVNLNHLDTRLKLKIQPSTLLV